jgi:transposase-like protein
MTTDAAIAGSERRRWTTAQKLKIVSESLAPQASVIEVARRHDLNPNLIYRWRHQTKIGSLARAPEAQSRSALVAVAVGGSARSSMRSDRDYDSVIEVLRNGRILRLSESAAPLVNFAMHRFDLFSLHADQSTGRFPQHEPVACRGHNGPRRRMRRLSSGGDRWSTAASDRRSGAFSSTSAIIFVPQVQGQQPLSRRR